MNGFVLSVEGLDRDDGPKDLAVRQRSAYNRRLEEPAWALGSLHVGESLDVVALPLGDERADLVAELQLPRTLGKTSSEVVMDAALDVDPLSAHTRLPRIEER